MFPVAIILTTKLPRITGCLLNSKPGFLKKPKVIIKIMNKKMKEDDKKISLRLLNLDILEFKEIPKRFFILFMLGGLGCKSKLSSLIIT